jgi:hypothetical protein
MVDAITVTLVGLSITGRRLLNGKRPPPAIAVAGRRVRSPSSGDDRSPAIAVASLVLVAVVRPHALPAAGRCWRCGRR